MINNVTLIGRLTRAVELKYTQSGLAVSRFTLAVNKFGKDDANFINCVAFKGTAEALANHTDKGSLVGVVGALETGSYEKDGVKRYTTDVICNSVQFLEPKKDRQQSKHQSTTQSNTDPFDSGQPVDIDTDDLPF